MNETPLHFKTITELGSLIKSKEISPVELTETMLTRIQNKTPSTRATLRL